MLPYYSWKLREHYEDHRIQYLLCQEILVYSVPHQSAPEHSNLHWQFMLIFVTAAFLKTKPMMQIKKCGDLWHLGDSETLNQNILCRPVSRCHPNTLFVFHLLILQSLAHALIIQYHKIWRSIYRFQQDIFDERSKSIIDQVFTLGFT